MELRHLHYFMAVAETLNFRKAAERLYISQPPLSRQIKDLENELGTELFIRTNKQVSLTPAGTFLYKEAQTILGNVESAKLVIKQLADLESGLLRIGYVTSMSYAKLSSAITLLKSKHPNVVTKLYEIPTIKQVAALENFKLDIGIIRAPLKSEKLAATRLFKERCCLVFPAAWRSAYDTKCGISAFSSAPFIFFNKEYAPEFRSMLMEICIRSGFTPTIEHESNNIHSILSLIEQEMGVSIVPESVKHTYTGTKLAFINTPKHSPETEILAVRSRYTENKIIDDFIAVLCSL